MDSRPNWTDENRTVLWIDQDGGMLIKHLMMLDEKICLISDQAGIKGERGCHIILGEHTSPGVPYHSLHKVFTTSSVEASQSETYACNRQLSFIPKHQEVLFIRITMHACLSYYTTEDAALAPTVRLN